MNEWNGWNAKCRGDSFTDAPDGSWTEGGLNTELPVEIILSVGVNLLQCSIHNPARRS